MSVRAEVVEAARSMKAAYNERLASGSYDAVKERRDLERAFTGLAHEKGLGRKETARLAKAML